MNEIKIPESIPAKVLYAIKTGTGVRPMKDLAGSDYHQADALVIGSYRTQDGENMEYAAIMTGGVVYRTPSPSFLRTLKAFLECFDPASGFGFRVSSRMSKGGRAYIVFEPDLEVT